MRRRAASAALVLAAGLTLAACGGDDDKSSGETKPDSSSSVTAGPSEALSAETFLPTISAAQAKAGSSHVEMTVEAAGQQITAEGDSLVSDDPSDSAMAMTMDLGDAVPGMSAMEIRLVDQVFYINVGAMTENKFAKIDLGDPDDPLAAQYGQLVEQMDPSRQIEQFKDSLSSFKQVGDAKTIDGVEATPYVLTLDAAKLQGITGAPTAGMPESVEYTMYIGPDNLPRRISSDIGGAALTMDYSKWGEDVDVKTPAADEISETDLSKQLG